MQSLTSQSHLISKNASCKIFQYFPHFSSWKYIKDYPLDSYLYKWTNISQVKLKDENARSGETFPVIISISIIFIDIISIQYYVKL